MFVVRSVLNGARVRHFLIDGEEKEKFETYEQAHRVFETMENGSQKKGLYQIEAIECGRCGGDDDLTIIHVDDEPKAFCQNCRVDLFGKKNPVGRPSVGVTKKVSLTLSEDDWYWLDKKAEGNRSKFLRKIVWNALGNEAEWDNYACLGYTVKGLEELSYSSEEIKKIVRAIYSQFDMTSVSEANKVYCESDY